MAELIANIYEKLYEHFGPRGWWLGDTRLEIMVGTILAQAVAWKNVKKAIDNLKAAGMLDYQVLLQVSEENLADNIKPALYHRQKAKKIKALLHFIENEYKGNLDLMFDEPMQELRKKLLQIWGIGQETADSILLYAGEKPVFVVDAYTRRIFSRLGLVDENIPYPELQDFMVRNVNKDVAVYNEYHALLVALGANYCRKKNPICVLCPINSYCIHQRSMQE